MVPEPLTAVMAADLRGSEELEEGRLFQFEMPQPIPSYLFAFAVGSLASKDLSHRCRIYAEPEVLESAAWEFADTEARLRAAEELFGPYEWDRYDLLIMPPSFPYGGMENPRLTFLTPTLLVGDRSLVSVITHELAHSWTGNLVTNATWADFWLNEGWTTYAELRIGEVIDGVEYVQLKRALEREGMFDEMKRLGFDSEPTKLHYSMEGVDPDEVYSVIPYIKGCEFLLSLEAAVGRDVFDGFIQEYIHAFRFQSIDTQGFLTFLGQELPDAVASVDIDSWIYKPGFPVSALEIQSKQLDAVHALLDDYKGGKLPTEQDVAALTPDQVRLFLRKLRGPVSHEHCAYLEWVFGLQESQDYSKLHFFYDLAIKSGYEAILPGVERMLGTVGRNIFLKRVYYALAGAEWSRPRVRDLFEAVRHKYHPLTVRMAEQILNEAGL
jgi:hypothetical protein